MDPWDVAAQRHAAQKQQAEIAVRVARERAAQEQAAQKAAEQAAYQEMQAAMVAATADLERFMAGRGAAAMRLLAEKERYVLFGIKQSKGEYSCVNLDGTGIILEIGEVSKYGYEPVRNEPTTASEAVRYFAYNGIGQCKPQIVRGIVSWLERQIDSIAGFGSTASS